jgi:hypothetical protein
MQQSVDTLGSARGPIVSSINALSLRVGTAESNNEALIKQVGSLQQGQIAMHAEISTVKDRLETIIEGGSNVDKKINLLLQHRRARLPLIIKRKHKDGVVLSQRRQLMIVAQNS